MNPLRNLTHVLSVPWVYELFQNAVGAKSARRWIAKKYWRLNGGEKIVDIGCGPGVILDYLPPGVTYIGFDISESYIQSAQAKYGSRATFIVSTASELLKKPDERFNNADLVVCNGLLHHLNDEESLEVLRFAHQVLKPGGRLVMIEACFLVRQNLLSKFIMNQDRGMHLREEQAWKTLVGKAFESYTTDIATALVLVPYVHIIIECRKLA